MALPGELKGLRPITCTCGATLPLKVCQSAAGFYLGHCCDNCGPYSRETGYFPTREIAEAQLDKEVPDQLRNTDFVPAALTVTEVKPDDTLGALIQRFRESGDINSVGKNRR